MNVSLTPQLESLIRKKVESGRYNNASEVVRQALRLLDEEEQQEVWLRTRMAEAEEQVRRGDVMEMTADAWDDLDRDVDARVSRRESPSPDVCPSASSSAHERCQAGTERYSSLILGSGLYPNTYVFSSFRAQSRNLSWRRCGSTLPQYGARCAMADAVQAID